MDGPVDGSWLHLEYDKTHNLTHFQYGFPAYTKSAYEWMWSKLTRFMHIEAKIINKTVQNATYNEDWGEGFIMGEPDLDEIKADLGNLTSTDSREIGYISEQYSSSLEIIYGTPRVIIKTSQFIATNLQSVELEIHLDDDGDIYLNINSKNKLSDPSSLFKPMFESINLPLSTLNEIKLEEVYAGYA
jgi:hypothetical protein